MYGVVFVASMFWLLKGYFCLFDGLLCRGLKVFSLLMYFLCFGFWRDFLFLLIRFLIFLPCIIFFLKKVNSFIQSEFWCYCNFLRLVTSILKMLRFLSFHIDFLSFALFFLLNETGSFHCWSFGNIRNAVGYVSPTFGTSTPIWGAHSSTNDYYFEVSASAFS